MTTRSRIQGLRRIAIVFTGLAALVGLVRPPFVPAQAADTTAWMTVRPGGDAACGFGDPFEFWVREGDASEFVLFLQGGGACFSHATCDPDRDLQFDPVIDTADHAQRSSGIFDTARPESPLVGRTFLFVPYCTGDFHLGDRRVTYPPPEGSGLEAVTVNHWGARNLEAVLNYVKRRPARPSSIFVVGASLPPRQ